MELLLLLTELILFWNLSSSLVAYVGLMKYPSFLIPCEYARKDKESESEIATFHARISPFT